MTVNFYLIHFFCQNISLKINISTNKRIVDQIDQILTVEAINVHTEIMYTFFLCIDVPFAHTAALIKIKCIIHAPLCILSLQGTFRNLLYCIRNCYIRIVCLMSGNQFSKIKIYGNICICHNNIFFFLFFRHIRCFVE